MKNRLFSHLFEKIKYDHILFLYLLDTLIVFYCSIITYMFSVVCYHGYGTNDPVNHWATMPEISDRMKIVLRNRRHYLISRHNYIRISNKLEPMEREENDSKHPALAQIFREKVTNAKSELLEIEKPIWGTYGKFHEFFELESMSIHTQ